MGIVYQDFSAFIEPTCDENNVEILRKLKELEEIEKRIEEERKLIFIELEKDIKKKIEDEVKIKLEFIKYYGFSISPNLREFPEEDMEVIVYLVKIENLPEAILFYFQDYISDEELILTYFKNRFGLDIIKEYDDKFFAEYEHFAPIVEKIKQLAEKYYCGYRRVMVY